MTRKIDLNNAKVVELKKRGRTECFLSELPSRRLAKKTKGIIAIEGNRAIFSSEMPKQEKPENYSTESIVSECMDKTVTITKMKKVKASEEYQAKGILAFQVVHFVINYFGNKIECSYDTKIMRDGSQLVIGGDGFIPHGYQIS